MEGSATFTIVASRMTMNCARQIKTRTSQGFALYRLMTPQPEARAGPIRVVAFLLGAQTRVTSREPVTSTHDSSVSARRGGNETEQQPAPTRPRKPPNALDASAGLPRHEDL